MSKRPKKQVFTLVPDTAGQMNHVFCGAPVPKGGFKVQAPTLVAHLYRLKTTDPTVYKAELKDYRKMFKGEKVEGINS